MPRRPTTSIKFTDGVRKDLEEAKEANGRTLSGQVRRYVTEGLERDGFRGPKKDEGPR